MARGYPDFEGGKSGLYLIPEWAAKEGKDKNINAAAQDVVPNTQTNIVSYTVPVGKTLVINSFSFMITGLTGNMSGFLYNLTTGLILLVCGGAQGFYAPLVKPIIIEASQSIILYAKHYCSANALIYGSIQGFEY